MATPFYKNYTASLGQKYENISQNKSLFAIKIIYKFFKIDKWQHYTLIFVNAFLQVYINWYKLLQCRELFNKTLQFFFFFLT